MLYLLTMYNSKTHQNKSIGSWFLALPFLFVSFTVSIDPIMSNLQLGIMLLSVIFFYVGSRRYLSTYDRGSFHLILLYLIPWLLSTSIGYFNNFITGNPLSYLELQPFGRLTNILVLSLLLFFFAHQPLSTERTTNKRIFLYYYYSLCILLVFALWQIADIYFNFPIPFPFQTRSYIHSESDLHLSFNKRITSYAAEPSFLAPFLIEGIILSVVAVRWKIARYFMIVLFLIVSILTFSPSAYIALIACSFVLLAYKLRKRILLVIPIVLFVSLFVLANIEEVEVLQYFVVRIENYSASSRYLGVILPIEYMFEKGNWITILFGYGMRGMGAFYNAHHHNFPFSTSNTMFVDIFFECGFVGLVCYVCIYYILFRRSIKVLNISPIPLLLFVNFFVSSLYRGDFSSLHFIGGIILIHIFTNERTSLYIYSKTRFDD